MRAKKNAGTLSDVTKFREYLRQRGLRATAQRIAVHEAMLDLVHAGAEQVCEHIERHSQTRVTVASVYNILSDLSDAGVYSRRLTSGSRMCFDLVAAPHLHLYDSRSGEFRDIPDDGLLEMVEGILRKKRFPGYKVDSVEIQIVCHPTRKSRQR